MEEIIEKQNKLTFHPVYSTFGEIENIRLFMKYHVFAVWDFMSLLKSLQIQLTCVKLPWRPSLYPTEIVRMINQIVVGEESDLGPDGQAISHFDLYLTAMKEIGADTFPIENFLKTANIDDIPQVARDFVKFNLDVSQKASVAEVAASFFFGREKLIPPMFEQIVETLEKEKIHAPKFIYYLKRHIEVDSGEHGPLALKAFEMLTSIDTDLKNRALKKGALALDFRLELWDRVLGEIRSSHLRN